MRMRPHETLTVTAPRRRVGRGRTWPSRLLAPATALALASVVEAGSAQAQSGVATAEPSDSARAAARRMMDEAAERYAAADYEAARDLYRRAGEADPGPAAVLGEARSLVKLGRLVAAEQRYAAVERSPVSSTDTETARSAVEEARDELEKLRQRIPTLTITVAGPEATDPTVEVQIDGIRVNPALLGYPSPVDPGDRVITLWVQGRKVVHVAVALQEGDRTPIVLRAEQKTAAAGPAPAAAGGEAPAPAVDGSGRHQRAIEAPPGGEVRRPIGWVAVGVGAAGLVTGLVAGLVAEDRHAALVVHCPEDRCPPEYHDDLDDFRRLRTVSTVGYVVGGVGLVAGVTLVLTAPRERGEARPTALTLQVGPAGAALRGRF